MDQAGIIAKTILKYFIVWNLFLESRSEMFGPLVFENVQPKTHSDLNGEISCLLCDKISLEIADFVKHIFEDHNLVIEEVQNIDNLSEYV